MSIPIPTTPRHHQNLHIFLLLHLLFGLSHVTITTAAAGGNHESLTLLSWLHTNPTNNSTSLSAYNSFINWNPSDPNPCKWTFITCSQNNWVTEIIIHSVPLGLPVPPNLSSFSSLRKLVISDANLTGNIPVEVGTYTGLSFLDLSSNSLTGDIPASVGKLRSLQTLALNSNQLTGKIPLELGRCTGLKNLLLFDNSLGGVLPPELGRLSSLEVLRVGGNKDIAGVIPSELGNCRNLTLLGLADTKISGSIPTSLGRLQKLQTLSIYTAMLSGEIPKEIGNCSELVNLYLYENSLSGSLPPELGKLQKLENMLLWQNLLAGAIPEEIGNCSSLKIIDLSINSLSGSIPGSFGRLAELEQLMLSDNNVSGSIPSLLSNMTHLSQLQLDMNQISGLIPPELGMLRELTVFLAWQNQLEGSIPSTLAGCSSLQALDLSHNSLTGNVPPDLFLLQNLTKLLLLSNDISGSIPPEIEHCKSLIRLRLGSNRIGGEIPKEIGSLTSIDFLDLSSNRLTGHIPDEIGNCSQLQMMDLSKNTLRGVLPESLSSLSGLHILDLSQNQILGQIPSGLGHLPSLNKLVLCENSLSGSIPASLAFCSSLQLLDLSNNELTGGIPVELCRIQSLGIALNLSRNALTGPIPSQISELNKLSVLDLSHNKLAGDLTPLAGLDNLVTLNVSYNNFSGYLPDTKLFRQLLISELAGNEKLCTSGDDSCFVSGITQGGSQESIARSRKRAQKFKLAMALLIAATVALLLGMMTAIWTKRQRSGDADSETGGEMSWPWQVTPFQKLNFSVDEVVRCLVDSNVIGKGCSGVVYRADMNNGEVIAVKKLWPTAMGANHNNDCLVRDSFSAEVKTLGSIRHKNIVKFLGCCWNRNMRLLMYDYMPNGSLGSLLHERTSSSLEWELRYHIVLGAAQGLAYLHHDCAPPIVHRDIKANNILIGLDFEPYIADFGLAKLVDDGDFTRSSNTVAGSYGYIAPEYGYMMKITEKSDVYSYGVVVLEVLTGKQPIDPTIPDGLHVVDWVRQKRGGVDVLDPGLRGRPEAEVEMLQALGVALLCINPSPEERPTMKDVAAMLKEIRHEREEYAKVDVLLKGSPANRKDREPTSSISVSCHPSNNTSFSASSLLYSSSSNAKPVFN